jgi:type I restriction enzyme S subunit
LAINSRLLELIDQAHGGAGLQHVTKPKLEKLPLTLPPEAEQQRIVSKVGELMALCDRLERAQRGRETRRDRLVEASLHRLSHPHETSTPQEFREDAKCYLRHLKHLTTRPSHVKQLRQSILNLAVRGRLVSQDLNDEPASELLKRIQAEKFKLIERGILRREKPLAPVTEAEVPFIVPASWRWSRLGTVSLLTEYGTSVKSEHANDGVPVVKMGDIQGGQVVLGGQKRVPRQIKDLPQLFLKRFDLLYNRTNSAELVGKTGIYVGDDDAFTFASYLIRIRFFENLISPLYANHAMNAPYFRTTQILPELQQQCGQANVNGSKLRNMAIPIPHTLEQLRIVTTVGELMTLCDQLETQIIAGQAESALLTESALYRYLNSNPQEPL